MGRIELDRKSYVKSLQGKSKNWIVFELAQNAFDEKGVTELRISVEYVADKREIHVIVDDDAPEGFRRLTDAYTMWTESLKVDDASMAGRFNEGDKKVFLFAEWAEVITTKGTVRFEGEERTQTKSCTNRGTTITAVFKGIKADYTDMLAAAQSLIAPSHIKLIVNSAEVIRRKPINTPEWTLPTVLGAELRPTQRKTVVEIYETSEPGWIYECGIPVVETGDRYDLNVLQRVPLNRDRDNVTPAYLKTIRALTLNEMHAKLPEAEFTKPWVAVAVTDKHALPAAVNSYLDAKYTKERVANDPAHPESVSLAKAQGMQVIYGRNEPAEVWAKAKESNLIPSAGQVFPAAVEIIKSDKMVPESEWTPGMSNIATYSKWIASRVIGQSIRVSYVNDSSLGTIACYGRHHLTYNIGRLGRAAFDHGPDERLNALLIHELAHEYEEDHFSSRYHDSLCDIGAKLTKLAMNEPGQFREFGFNQ